MNCEIGIHEAFIELKQNICPFCKQPLVIIIIIIKSLFILIKNQSANQGIGWY